MTALVVTLVVAEPAVHSRPAGAATDPKISVGDVSIVEGDSGARTVFFPVTLSEPATADVHVDYRLVAGTATPGTASTPSADFNPKRSETRPLVFKVRANGTTPVARYVGVTIYPDTIAEGNETFTLTLSSASPGWSLGQATATGTIVDDDADPGAVIAMSIGDVSIQEGDVGARAAKFAVTLSAPATSEITVDYAITDGSAHCGAVRRGVPLVPGTDCEKLRSAMKTLRFPVRPTGATVVERVVTGVVLPDSDAEGDETFRVSLFNPAGPVVVARATGTATIRDDDAIPASSVLAVTAGASYTCARRGNGTVKCWGDNGLGELGLGKDTWGADEIGNNLPVVDLGTGRTAKQISAGDNHTCAVLDDDTVKCWGYDDHGSLGEGVYLDSLGDAPGEMGDNLGTVDLGTGRHATQIAAGPTHTCAVLDDGSLKCWGANYLGALGLGDHVHRGRDPSQMGDNLPAVDLGTGRTARQVAVGNVHTCAVLDDGTVKCWGDDSMGELGLGDPQSRGDEPGEMGDNLPPVDLGTGRTATQIAVSENRSCAVLDNGAVKCWGAGGLLGIGTAETHGNGPGEMGDNLPAVDLGSGRSAIQIAVGRSHTCAVLDDRTVKCWGDDSMGELGLGDTAFRGDGPGEMGDNLPPVDLGSGRRARQVDVGAAHTCAVLDQGVLKCWGRNGSGILGLGDTNNRGDAPGEMGDNLPAVDLGAA